MNEIVSLSFEKHYCSGLSSIRFSSKTEAIIYLLKNVIESSPLSKYGHEIDDYKKWIHIKTHSFDEVLSYSLKKIKESKAHESLDEAILFYQGHHPYETVELDCIFESDTPIRTFNAKIRGENKNVLCILEELEYRIRRDYKAKNT